MIEDRLYRFLIPGSIFGLTFLCLIAADPSISLDHLVATKQAMHVKDFVGVAFAGSILLVVTGYFCSEFFHLLCWPNPKMTGLTEKERNRFCELIGISKEEKYTREIPTIFTHGPLDKKWPGVKSYLQRSWSHILICWFSIGAIIFAYLLWVATSFYLRYLPESGIFDWPTWFHRDRWAHAQFIYVGTHAAIVCFLVIVFLLLSAVREHRHRKRIYQLLLKSDCFSAEVCALGARDDCDDK